MAMKTEDGKQFPAGDYAYVPDPARSSTWKLRLTSEPGGAPDPGIVGAACAALGAGFRGRTVEIPGEDRAKVVAKVRAAWREANPGKSDDEMPMAIHLSTGTGLETEDFGGVELARVGTFTDMHGNSVDFTAEDFDQAVQAWNDLGDSVLSAPLRLGTHDEEKQLLSTEDRIATGWATNLRRSGDKLLVDFRRVPRKVASLIKEGAFRKRSAGFIRNFEHNGKNYHWVLDHVALLGGTPPAINDLKDVLALYSEKDTKGLTVILLSREMKATPHTERSEEDMKKELIKQFNLAEDAKDDDILAKVTELSEAAAEAESLKAELSKKEEKITALSKPKSGVVELSQETLTQLQSDAAAGKKAMEDLTTMQVERDLVELMEAGKIVPAQKEAAEGSLRKDRDGFMALMANARPVLEAGGIGLSNQESPTLMQMAQERVRKDDTLSFRMAVDQIIAERPELAAIS